MYILTLQIDPNRPSFKELNGQLAKIEETLRAEEELELQKKLQQEEMKKAEKAKAEPLYIETPVKNGKLYYSDGDKLVLRHCVNLTFCQKLKKRSFTWPNP
jgi:hypothetical protein